MAKHFEIIHAIGLHEQLAMMRLVHPTFRCAVRGGALLCRGKIQPTELNRAYMVLVEYRANNAPRASVLDPVLRRREPSKVIPHTYPVDRPCLFLPTTGEWRPDKYIALTIIPWFSEWLFYYEAWRATGEWYGGGVHPVVVENFRVNRRAGSRQRRSKSKIRALEPT